MRYKHDIVSYIPQKFIIKLIDKIQIIWYNVNIKLRGRDHMKILSRACIITLILTLLCPESIVNNAAVGLVGSFMSYKLQKLLSFIFFSGLAYYIYSMI